MARKANEEDLNHLVTHIKAQPGKRIGFWARLFGRSREKVTRQLVTLNDKGVLFYEEEDGGIYFFDRD